MKPDEIAFVSFLDAMAIPQCRIIIEVLARGPQSLKDLIRISKLSPKSIELHIEPLLKSKIITAEKTNSAVTYRLNKKVFMTNSLWFESIRTSIEENL